MYLLSRQKPLSLVAFNLRWIRRSLVDQMTRVESMNDSEPDNKDGAWMGKDNKGADTNLEKVTFAWTYPENITP